MVGVFILTKSEQYYVLLNTGWYAEPLHTHIAVFTPIVKLKTAEGNWFCKFVTKG